MSEAKRVVGLTGGIASGKSTVGKMFVELGVTVIDADQLAREVVEPGTEGLTQVVGHFGSDFLTPEGTLDRPKLGLRVFSDPSALKTLESIVHPLVAALFTRRCGEAKQLPTPYVIYENAILVETGLHRTLDKLIVVSAEHELQVARVMKRNKLTREQAEERIAAQFPLERKLEVADLVILNDNDRDALRGRVLDTHNKLISCLA